MRWGTNQNGMNSFGMIELLEANIKQPQAY